MKAHFVRRLNRLADFLDTVPVRNFDLELWHNGEKDCKTVACAMGWAAAIPEFRRAGLRLSARGFNSPEFKGAKGYLAAQEFFGLTEGEAFYLFQSTSYEADSGTRPKTVARRIRKFAERSK